jgi:hypothetical protein
MQSTLSIKEWFGGGELGTAPVNVVAPVHPASIIAVIATMANNNLRLSTQIPFLGLNGDFLDGAL